jgi:hypothetical protein
VRKVFSIGALLAGLALIAALIMPTIVCEPPPREFTIAMGDLRDVGSAVKLYAADHQGRLPKELKELMPAYLLKESRIEDMQLTVPGAVFSDLPANSIILFKPVAHPKKKSGRVVFVRADLSADMVRF